MNSADITIKDLMAGMLIVDGSNLWTIESVERQGRRSVVRAFNQHDHILEAVEFSSRTAECLFIG